MRIGEVVEARTSEFWVELDNVGDPLEVGTVITTSNRSGSMIVGITGFVETAGIDPSRRAIRRGSIDVQDEEIYLRHPELHQILRTTMLAVPVAYVAEGRINSLLPPMTPALHYSVSLLDEDSLREITGNIEYLKQVMRSSLPIAVEQLLIHHVRWVYRARGYDREWLDQAARQIAHLYHDQYDELVPILESIDPESAGNTPAPLFQ